MSEQAENNANDLLLAAPESHYGDSYRADFLTLYRDYVASAESVSTRRALANKFFVGINTALIGIRGYFEVDSNQSVIVLAVVGILLSVVWHRMIQSYRTLNASKFDVIQLMEKHLPAAAYTAEYYIQTHGPIRHRSLTSVETFVPLLFALLHVAIAAYQLTQGNS